MAKTMSIIRYKYKADRDFESVQFEGTGCSLGELKRLIAEKSSRSGTNHSRDDYDLIVSNATTHEEYRDNSDLIPRNASVVVARRIRGNFESLTPATNQKLVVSSDDIVNEYLRPVIQQTTSSSVIEGKLEMLAQSNNPTSAEELSEDERIKQIVKISQARYLPAQRSTTSNVCHHCKQAGHLRNQCPVLLQSSLTTNASTSSSTGSHPSKPDGTSSTSLGATSYSSHIITHQAPYHMVHHHHYNTNRPHHRSSGYTRREPPVKKATGIPRDDLIQVPRHITGAFQDPTGASVIPRPMAQLIVEESVKKAGASVQRHRSLPEKDVLPSAASSSVLPGKSTDDEQPPDDLLCPICKQVYTDAVIIPCCHNSFCDACIRTALVESEEHECPFCHRQNVPIDHINPNLFLRKYVNRWYEERQQKSSYSQMSLPQQTSVNNYSVLSSTEHDPNSTSTSANTQNLDDIDEYDIAILPTSVPTPVPVRTAPIVIRMQPIGQSPSPPQSTVLTKPADIAFEDGKAPDSDQTTSSQKDANSESSANSNSNDQNVINQSSDTSDSQIEKSDRETPPSQVAPLSTVLSSPSITTTAAPTMMTETTSVVPHYYPPSSHILSHQQPLHPNMMYPQQIPPRPAPGYYPMQPNFYSPAAHVPYPGGHPSVGPIMHRYPVYPMYSTGHHHHPMGLPHLQPNPMNGYPMGQYEVGNGPVPHQPNPTFPNPSTSTLLPQNLQTAPTSALTKDEFYKKQRNLQQGNRSTSHRRSSSASSYTSSDSRSSSFSRRHNHRHRRSTRSRSRQQTTVRHPRKSPIHRSIRRSSRSTSKHRQSSSRYQSSPHRDRVRVPSTRDERSSHHRKSPPRSHQSTRDRERRRSPRPPPTVHQSTQRTIIYKDQPSSSKKHSKQDDRSPIKDTRVSPSSKIDEQPQMELRLSVSPIPLSSDHKSPTLSSAITTIHPGNDENSNNDKKRKKHHHHHHKKHRRHHSNSPNSSNDNQRSQDREEKSVSRKDRTTHSVVVVHTH